MSCTFWNLRRRKAKNKTTDKNSAVPEKERTEKPVKKGGGKNDKQ